MPSLYVIGGANGSGKTTVASGGHSIPEEVIRRRYERGRRNFISLYLPLCDSWMVFDNSSSSPVFVAEEIINQQPIIYEEDIWCQITGGLND